jgi:hypothetical protein
MTARPWAPRPKAGDIVQCRFPESKVGRPGPKDRPVLVVEVEQAPEDESASIVRVAYGTTNRHRANEEVGIGSLHASTTTLLEVLGRQLIIFGVQPQVRECTELLAQPFVLRMSTNPGQELLSDRPDHDDAVGDDQAFQLIGESIVSSRDAAPENKRPDRRIDKNFHATRRCFL